MTSPDVQERLQSALGGAYTVGRELGGGGMSRVFVADEATLGRKVVVKVLRPELAEGLSAERFKREVKLAAQLQHPHVVPLLAAGELDGGVLYYTMPFVEGESLRARLDHGGAMPIAEILRILRDAASALAYAHGRGIVHRDIKPDNVLLSHGGAVVADFGIAKAITAASDTPRPDGATHASTLTAAGTSLGTPAYMAPEQAAGDVVDHRADLYALGVVAYEMLTGRPPFEGRTAQQLLAAHATQAPEHVERRRASVPAALGALVMQLLEKHPADRPQRADDVIVALDAPALPSSAPTPSASPSAPRAGRTRRAVPWLAAAAVATFAGVGGAALGWDIATRRSDSVGPARPVISTLGPPIGYELRADSGQALSPDGTRFAFVAADARGATSIWLRSLDQPDATPVERTDGATAPFWSPDGQSLAYFARGQLYVQDLRSGTRRALCPALRPGGGAWTSRGVIVYSPEFLGTPLYRVNATGDPHCAPLTKWRPGDSDHRRPAALPDGHRVLFSSSRKNRSFAADVETGAMTEVLKVGVEATFARPHWLLFRDLNGPKDNSGPLYAQRLDMNSLKPIGERRVILDRTDGGVGIYFRFSATQRALVAVRPSDRPWSLLWVDRRSSVVDSIIAPPEAGPMLGAQNIGVSHNGRSIAFGGRGLWIYSPDLGSFSRYRVESEQDQAIVDPAWSPGDSLIAFTTALKGSIMLRLFHVRSGTIDSLWSFGWRTLRSPTFSPDGARIAFQASSGGTARHYEIWVYTLATHHAERAFETAGNLSLPRWSPDGRWMAYVSDETGPNEVYVRRLDRKGVPVQVSNSGGDVPLWRPDGRELYYRAPDGAIMGVSIALGDAAVRTKPRVVVVRPPFDKSVHSLSLTRDGNEFIGFGRAEPPVFTLMMDWAEKMK